MRVEISNREKITLFTKQDGTRKFEILDVVGLGANCIVYNACFYDEYSIRHFVKLKECCPLLGVIGREGSNVVWNTFEEKKEAFRSFEKMYKQHMRLQELFDVVNATCKITDSLYYGNDTMYLVMESDYGMSFDKAVPDTLFEILQALYALTNTIGKYHDIGFLHLDIKPQNFMVIPETKELVKLFDFDSLVPMNDMSLGIAENISYSNEWAAPEVKQKKIRRIKETADVYSVGTVLFYAIFGRTISAMDKLSFGKYNFEDVPLVRIVNPLIKRKLVNFLVKTLNPVIAKRYQNMNEVKNALQEMMIIADPTRNYLCSSIPEQVNVFCGRINELETAHNILKKDKRVIVTGIGGIGKSEFSKRFARQFQEDYSAVVWVKREGTFENTILLAGNFVVSNSNNASMSQEITTYEEKIEAIGSVIDEKALIILDDISDFAEKALQKFLKLQCNIMITTRTYTGSLMSNIGCVELSRLDAKQAREVFDYYYKVAIDNQESVAINEIIDIIDGYTLLIPIIAKQMTISGIRPKEMLETMKRQGISVSMPEKVQHIKDEELINDALMGHVKNVLDMSKMNEEKLLVLRVLSTLTDINIGKKSLAAWCGFRDNISWELFKQKHAYRMFWVTTNECLDLSVINNLIEGGWLQYDEITDRVSLHNVIVELIRTEYTPDVCNCKPFIRSLKEIASDIEWGDESVNEYTVEMHLLVINEFLSKLIVNNSSTAEVVINILDSVYKMNPEMFIECICDIINNSRDFCSNNEIVKLRKMQVYAYLKGYGLGQLKENDTQIEDAAIIFKKSVCDFRKLFSGVDLYNYLIVLFEDLFDHGGFDEQKEYVVTIFPFDEQKKYVVLYKYMLRILNEISKYGEDKVKIYAIDTKKKLIKSHREFLSYLKRKKLSGDEKIFWNKDELSIFEEELEKNWDKLDKSFEIIARMMSSEQISISGKRVVMSSVGSNPREFDFGIFGYRGYFEKYNIAELAQLLLSIAELEAAVFFKEMYKHGLFKDEEHIRNQEDHIEQAIHRQCMYLGEKRGLFNATQHLISINSIYIPRWGFGELQISEVIGLCKSLTIFSYDIIALWIYREIEETYVEILNDYDFDSLKSSNIYALFLKNALECAELLEDYESYYYFYGKIRDNLVVDFDFDKSKKPNVFKDNKTYIQWKKYIEELRYAQSEYEIDDIKDKILVDKSLHSNARKFLVEIIEEKTTLRSIRVNAGKVPIKRNPDVSLMNRLIDKHINKNGNESIWDSIDEIGEIVLQSVLIGDECKTDKWSMQYINIIDAICSDNKDCINVYRYYLLPYVLIEIGEQALAKKIFRAMIKKWLNTAIGNYNYYELKTNSCYLDHIYEFAGTDEEIILYNSVKKHINENWGGEEHLKEYY